ncbi:hypothetical protein CPB83DRAFT_187802 [Crepidotus variabilis]|uniref:Uncharacterized protein n=1 Tax=Crepidotus variabilis TaxID=179855 RepID=A0A9P6JRE3_9AGAR|nr:hypothetical protein CPB83DRAFT_187802 [Crepidotus variabilis]
MVFQAFDIVMPSTPSVRKSSSSRSKSSNNDSNNRTPAPSFGPCPSCVVQDNDPRVRYQGVWQLNGPGQFTTHSTVETGASVSMTFNGTGVTVFGTVPASNATASPPTVMYTLDSNLPITITLPLADRDIANQPFFASDMLSTNETHSLTINITAARSPFKLARFVISPPPSASQDTGGSSAPPTDIADPNISTLPLNPSSVAQPQTNELQTLKILIGALATLIFLVLISVFALLIYRWRPGRRRAILDKELRVSPQVPYPRASIYTSFTSTDSIMRNDSRLWSNSSSRGPASRMEDRKSAPISMFNSASPIPAMPPGLPTSQNRLSQDPFRSL